MLVAKGAEGGGGLRGLWLVGEDNFEGICGVGLGG